MAFRRYGSSRSRGFSRFSRSRPMARQSSVWVASTGTIDTTSASSTAILDATLWQRNTTSGNVEYAKLVAIWLIMLATNSEAGSVGTVSSIFAVTLDDEDASLGDPALVSYYQNTSPVRFGALLYPASNAYGVGYDVNNNWPNRVTPIKFNRTMRSDQNVWLNLSGTTYDTSVTYLMRGLLRYGG